MGCGSSFQKDVTSLEHRVGAREETEIDLKALHKYVNRIIPDSKEIVEILLKYPIERRLELVEAFKTYFQEDLITKLEDKLNGNIKELVLGLLYRPSSFDVMCIRKALKNSDFEVLIEIIPARTLSELEAIKLLYKDDFLRTLEEDLSTSISDENVLDILLHLCTMRPQHEDVTQQSITKLSEQLHVSGDVVHIVTQTHSKRQLKLVIVEYQQKYDQDILEVIESKYEGELVALLTAVVSCAFHTVRYLATEVNRALKGFGTMDSKLIRIVVSRAEVRMISLYDIKSEYLRTFASSLVDDVKSDCSGNLQDILIKLITTRYQYKYSHVRI